MPSIIKLFQFLDIVQYIESLFLSGLKFPSIKQQTSKKMQSQDCVILFCNEITEEVLFCNEITEEVLFCNEIPEWGNILQYYSKIAFQSNLSKIFIAVKFANKYCFTMKMSPNYDT